MLFRHAGHLIVRRWPLYAIATLVAVAIQLGLLVAPGVPRGVAIVVGDVFAFAPLAAIVFGFGAADSVSEEVRSAAVWGRIAERIWAVVILEAVFSLVQIGIFLGAGTSEIAQNVGQLGVLILLTLLAFAETHAIVAPDEKPARLLLDSVLASVRITTTRIGYGRAVGVVLVPFLIVQVVQDFSESLLAAAVVLPAILTVPVAALTVVFYLDCLALAGSQQK